MATECREGVWRLRGRGVNAYLVESEAVTLVDAGTPWDAGRLRRGIESTGHGLGAIDRVLVTHYDLDHVGALAALGRAGLTATVHLAEPDRSYLTGRTRPPWWTRKGLVQRATAPLVDAPALDIERVRDGDGVGGFDVYHTPGHTPGHVAYEHEGRSVLCVGDLLLERDGRLRASPWYLSYDTDAVAESVRDLADRAPAFEVLAMGHGDPVVEKGSVALARLAEAAARRA